MTVSYILAPTLTLGSLEGGGWQYVYVTKDSPVTVPMLGTPMCSSRRGRIQ